MLEKRGYICMRSSLEGSVLVSGLAEHHRNNCLLVLETQKARVEELYLQGLSGMSEHSGRHHITESGRKETQDLLMQQTCLALSHG